MFRRMTATTLAMVVCAGLCTSAMAQDSGKKQPRESAPKAEANVLKVGSKAPALTVEEFVKGDRVAKLEEGKVYVVEFWATWCPPCVKSIPHLTELQKKYKDKGVTIIGIAGSERGGNDKSKISGVENFVKKQGEKMNYTVAYDGDRSMSKDWMQAAGQGGIPCAFVVDKEGKIAFIGNPLSEATELENAIKKASEVTKADGGFRGHRAVTLASFQPEKQPEKKAEATDEKAAEKAKEKKQTEAKLPEVMLGDKAPEIQVGKFVKGEPVTGFEKGRTYVVEFWATWCGPCKDTIPHLTELQKENKDVRFVGVSVWEHDQSAVEPFVKEMGEEMEYSVAMDALPEHDKEDAKARRKAAGEGKMAKTWMEAAGYNSIPTAFIVNGEGKVAWIGHPAEIDEPLEQIKTGKWDLEAKAKEYRQSKEAAAKVQPLMNELREAAAAGDQDRMLKAMDDLIQADPSQAQRYGVAKFSMLMEAGEFDRAYSFANEMIGGALKDNAQALNSIAWSIVDPDMADAIEKKDYKVALRAAQRADEVSKHKDAAIIDTLARVHFVMGDLDKALSMQKDALKAVDTTQWAGDKDELRAELEGRLKEYEAAAEKKK